MFVDVIKRLSVASVFRCSFIFVAGRFFFFLTFSLFRESFFSLFVLRVAFELLYQLEKIDTSTELSAYPSNGQVQNHLTAIKRLNTD